MQRKQELDQVPEMILFGTILERRTSVAPTRGVTMEVAYRLEFFEVAEDRSTIVEVAVKFLAEGTITEIVAELGRRSGKTP